jgi:hypothetical protein
MEVLDETTLSASYVFRGMEYIITMSVQDGISLTVEVEDRLTADQWRASLDTACEFGLPAIDLGVTMTVSMLFTRSYFTTTTPHQKIP